MGDVKLEPGKFYSAVVKGGRHIGFVSGVGGARAFSYVGGDGRYASIPGSALSDVRPVVVLDFGPDGVVMRDAARVLHENKRHTLAQLIESQLTPPRITEPGLYGVVKDVHGNQYVRTHTYAEGTPANWYDQAAESLIDWDSIEKPELVRKGIHD